jgi:hypothetical protein
MRLAAILLGAFAVSSCHVPRVIGPLPQQGRKQLDTVEMIHQVYYAVDHLLAQHPKMQDTDRILVATAVDVNNVQRTSELGRVMTECIQSRLTHNDHDVIHPTVREDHLLVQHDGQFLLSRDARNLAVDYNARSALVATYSVVSNSVVVSMKLVSTVENSTLAAQDFVLERTESISEMLESTVGRR